MTDTEQTATAPDTKAPLPTSGRPVHMPGDCAMWLMVLGDFVFFGAYFVILWSSARWRRRSSCSPSRI